MQRNVAIDEVNTPAGQLAVVESMLGKVVEPLRTRWALGSLAVACLASVEASCVLATTSETMVVYQPEDAAEAATLQAAFEAGAPGDTYVFNPAAEGTSRNRALVSADGLDYQVTAAAGYAALSDNAKSVIDALVLPESPVTSLASIISKVGTILGDRDVPVDFGIFVNQFTGDVVVSFDGVYHVGEVEASAAAGNGEVIASFDLSAPVAVVAEENATPFWG